MPLQERIRNSGWFLRARYSGEVGRAVAADGVTEAAPGTFRPLLRRLYADCDSVLDVGTGRMDSLAGVPCSVKVGLEAHRPYLEHRLLDDAVPVNASALDLGSLFPDDAFDLVTLMDVVEHFDEADAREVLRQAEAVARRRTLLFTPRGEFPQEGHDQFGLGGEELQRHRSAWEPGELAELGFRVVVLRGYHGPWNASFVEGFGPDADPVDALLAWKDSR